MCRPCALFDKELTSSPPLEKGGDPDEVWFGFNQSSFGGLLFHRSALLRRISAGFTSGLPGPKTRAIYPRSQERSLTAHLVRGLHEKRNHVALGCSRSRMWLLCGTTFSCS